MKYTKSLKKNTDFKKVYRVGKSTANKFLVLYKLPNNLPYNRLGVSVSKKVGNSVVRSRVTRLIKESYRLNEHEGMAIGFDIIIIARTIANEASYHDIENSLIKLLRQHKIINNKLI
ncbi:MAG: ribonuclease P protein component [Epulopiscium sp. Nele67-Bin005]|nr:MAG: ribonuclease P protein component [Epulopiscium sp. Nele67-Bin005]